MKHLFLSTFIVLIIGLISIGATIGYFSDTETSTDNSFTAGKLDMRLSSESVTGIIALPVNITDAKPGDWSDLYQLNIINETSDKSTIAVKYRFYDQFVSGDSDLYSNLNVRVRHATESTPDPSSWPIVYDGTLDNLMIDSNVLGQAITVTIPVGERRIYYLEFQLIAGADVNLQSKTAEFNIVGEASSVDNPGWD